MGYYVDLDVDEMADELWANHPATAAIKPGASNISGNICPDSAKNEENPTNASDCRALPYVSEGDGNRTRNHRIDRSPWQNPKKPVFPEDFNDFTPFDRFCKVS